MGVSHDDRRCIEHMPGLDLLKTALPLIDFLGAELTAEFFKARAPRRGDGPCVICGNIDPDCWCCVKRLKARRIRPGRDRQRPIAARTAEKAAAL
jgi:hypothetical protein